MLEYIFPGLSLGVFAFWFRMLLEGGKYQRGLGKLQKATAQTVQGNPLVSVIVPARNEGKHISSCLSSLENQTYKNFEVILVNDRSGDDTGAVMQAAIKKNPNWKYIDVKFLPSQWLGKNHANFLGVQESNGSLFLFTDGDVIFQPEAIEYGLKVMQGAKLDHVVLSPRFTSKSWILSSIQICFSVKVFSMLKPSRIGKSPNSYIGIGAFNLVTRAAYQKSGGHQKLKLEVLDDIMLGKIIVRTGGRQALADGQSVISLEWYSGWKEMIKGLEKNGFAALRYSLTRIVKLTLEQSLLFLFPYFAFTQDFPFKGFLIAGLAIMYFIYFKAAYRMKAPLYAAFFTPILSWVLWYAFVRSAFLAVYTNAIKWRDTSYSLKDLKENML